MNITREQVHNIIECLGIIENASFLVSDQVPDDMKKYFNMIINNAKKCRDIVDAIDVRNEAADVNIPKSHRGEYECSNASS